MGVLVSECGLSFDRKKRSSFSQICPRAVAAAGERENLPECNRIRSYENAPVVHAVVSGLGC